MARDNPKEGEDYIDLGPIKTCKQDSRESKVVILNAPEQAVFRGLSWFASDMRRRTIMNACMVTVETWKKDHKNLVAKH